MNDNPIPRTYIVVARCVAPGWLEVVEDFTVPDGDIEYPYMRAAYADAQARASRSVAEFRACLLRAPIREGRQFNRLTEDATFIDKCALQSAKPV